ncbi:MAG: hypothetical protein EOO20_14805 [Chryseobacterium sp.]|nr:MAG: hypothetical protein EOO20_14805 [Chryseobacterium sp.]
MEIVVAKTQPAVTNTDLIRGIENPGVEFGIHFPVSIAATIRSAASGLKWQFPTRKYSVKESESKLPDHVLCYWERRSA